MPPSYQAATAAVAASAQHTADNNSRLWHAAHASERMTSSRPAKRARLDNVPSTVSNGLSWQYQLWLIP